jgi:hypothetical protein
VFALITLAPDKLPPVPAPATNSFAVREPVTFALPLTLKPVPVTIATLALPATLKLIFPFADGIAILLLPLLNYLTSASNRIYLYN